MAEADTKARRRQTARAALQFIHKDTDVDYRDPLVQQTILELARGGWLKRPPGTAPPPPSSGRITATGTSRRLQALVYEGWSVSQVASYLSLSARTLQSLARGETRTVAPEVADEVAEMFEDTPEPPPSREQSRSKVLRNAKRHGFLPRHRWDGLDIDDPGVHPHPLVV